MRNPQFRSTRDGCVVSHSELIEVLTQDPVDTFVTRSFSLNPGLSATFPWLSKTAQNFEMYWIRRLTVEYRPRVGYTTNGSVILYVDYDAKDAVAGDYKTAATMGGAKSGAPYIKNILTASVPKLMRNAKKYVRSAPGQGDITLYDAGTLNVGAQTAAGSVLLGEIWVHYQVELISPQTSVGHGPVPTVGAIAAYTPASAPILDGIVKGLLETALGTTPIKDSLGFGATDAKGSIVVPSGRDGQYKITTHVDGSTGTDTADLACNNTVNGSTNWASIAFNSDNTAFINYLQTGGEMILDLFAGDILRPEALYNDLTAGSTAATVLESTSYIIELLTPFLGFLSVQELAQRKERAIAKRAVQHETYMARQAASKPAPRRLATASNRRLATLRPVGVASGTTLPAHSATCRTSGIGECQLCDIEDLCRDTPPSK